MVGIQKLLKLAIILMTLSLAQSNTLFAESRAPVILVYGDSLSAAYGMSTKQGWVTLLQEQLKAEKFPHQVVNASISGETTSGGLTRFANTLKTHQPQMVVLELGANDGLRGLPMAEMRSNLAAMIKQSQQANAKVLLLGVMIPPNYGPRYTQQFKESFTILAQQHRLTLVPFFLQDVAGNPNYLQSDGLHPNAAAQATIMQNVWKFLRPALVNKKR